MKTINLSIKIPQFRNPQKIILAIGLILFLFLASTYYINYNIAVPYLPKPSFLFICPTSAEFSTRYIREKDSFFQEFRSQTLLSPISEERFEEIMWGEFGHYNHSRLCHHLESPIKPRWDTINPELQALAKHDGIPQSAFRGGNAGELVFLFIILIVATGSLLLLLGLRKSQRETKLD